MTMTYHVHAFVPARTIAIRRPAARRPAADQFQQVLARIAAAIKLVVEAGQEARAMQRAAHKRYPFTAW
jgi:hypothetical protein